MNYRVFFTIFIMMILFITVNGVYADDLTPVQCLQSIMDFDDDRDEDEIHDECEATLAEMFSPVIHKDPRDLQRDLAKPEDLFGHAKLKLGNEMTDDDTWYDVQTLEDSTDFHIHYPHPETGDTLCTYAQQEIYFSPIGAPQGMDWGIDIDDGSPDHWVGELGQAHPGSPPDKRHLFYHVFRDSITNTIQLQYWMFFTMNDNSDHGSWHEGDWEMVALQLNPNDYNPINVNFSQHHGFRTAEANECYWGEDTEKTLVNVILGIPDINHTHLHVWSAKNSHALYNKYWNHYKVDSSLIPSENLKEPFPEQFCHFFQNQALLI